MTIAVNRNLSNCKSARKKGFRGFYRIQTCGPCISATVLYQPELWRPIHWRPANLLSSSTCERNETQNEMIWTAGIQMKWVCDHRSESQFKQFRIGPKKRISGLQRDSNLWPLPAWDMKTHTLEAGQFIYLLAQWPRFRIPLKPRNPFFGAYSQLFKLRFTAMVTYLFHLYSRSSYHFILWKVFCFASPLPFSKFQFIFIHCF